MMASSCTQEEGSSVPSGCYALLVEAIFDSLQQLCRPDTEGGKPFEICVLFKSIDKLMIPQVEVYESPGGITV